MNTSGSAIIHQCQGSVYPTLLSLSGLSGHNISECEHPRRNTTPGTTAKETPGERESQTYAEPRLTAIEQQLPLLVAFSVWCEPQSASVDPPVEPLPWTLQSLPAYTIIPLLSLCFSLFLTPSSLSGIFSPVYSSQSCFRLYLHGHGSTACPIGGSLRRPP